MTFADWRRAMSVGLALFATSACTDLTLVPPPDSSDDEASADDGSTDDSTTDDGSTDDGADAATE